MEAKTTLKLLSSESYSKSAALSCNLMLNKMAMPLLPKQTVRTLPSKRYIESSKRKQQMLDLYLMTRIISKISKFEGDCNLQEWKEWRELQNRYEGSREKKWWRENEWYIHHIWNFKERNRIYEKCIYEDVGKTEEVRKFESIWNRFLVSF